MRHCARMLLDARLGRIYCFPHVIYTRPRSGGAARVVEGIGNARKHANKTERAASLGDKSINHEMFRVFEMGCRTFLQWKSENTTMVYWRKLALLKCNTRFKPYILRFITTLRCGSISVQMRTHALDVVLFCIQRPFPWPTAKKRIWAIKAFAFITSCTACKLHIHAAAQKIFNQNTP